MINYVIELSVVHLSLIIAYWFFLRKERQYHKMRSYLLSSTLLAIALPFLKLPKLIGNLWTTPEPNAPLETITFEPATVVVAADTFKMDFTLLVYPSLMISLVLLYQITHSILYLLKLERGSQSVTHEEYNIRKTDQIEGSFTFFNWIFVGKKVFEDLNEYTAILKHEQAHAELGHTYDLLFFQVFRMLFWWLPSAWYINKEIKKIHEYQADAYALKAFSLDWYSSILISSTLKSNGLSLASSFHDGLILKRLKAMKQNARKVSPWKMGALLSLVTLLFVMLACSEEMDQGIKEMGLSNNSITFDQLPTEMQKNLSDIKDQLIFTKLTIEDNEITSVHGLANMEELQGLDPNTIHSVNVDKSEGAVFIAIKKDGANFDYLAETSKMDEEIFTIVEDAPEYPGGMDAFYRYIGEHMDYPKTAREAGVEGKVYVQFVVDKDGSLSDVTVVKGIGSGCDEEAKRVIGSLNNFKPGKQRGKAVRVRMVLPITFRLGEKLNEDASNKGVIVIEDLQENQTKLKIGAALEENVWKGTIYDPETGKPLPGASIVVEGTTSGTVSDLKGNFKLQVSDRTNNLLVSFMGYQTTKLTAPE